MIKIEKRSVSELAFAGSLHGYTTEFAIDGQVVCISAANIARSVGLRALSVAHSNDLIAPPLLMHFTVGLVDEVIMRGILIRVVQKSAGSKLALLASALLCSAVHMFNDNVSAIRWLDKVNLYRYHTTSVFNTGQGFTVKALP